MKFMNFNNILILLYTIIILIIIILIVFDFYDKKTETSFLDNQDFYLFCYKDEKKYYIILEYVDGKNFYFLKINEDKKKAAVFNLKNKNLLINKKYLYNVSDDDKQFFLSDSEYGVNYSHLFNLTHVRNDFSGRVYIRFDNLSDRNHKFFFLSYNNVNDNISNKYQAISDNSLFYIE